MIANKLTILTATAALLEPALALGHRHGHQHPQKRGEWITATIDGQVVSWENNYFGPGGAPAATQAASKPEAPAAPAPATAQPTTIIKVAKPSQAAKAASKPAKAAYEAPKAEEKAAAPKKAVKAQQVKAASPPRRPSLAPAVPPAALLASPTSEVSATTTSSLPTPSPPTARTVAGVTTGTPSPVVLRA